MKKNTCDDRKHNYLKEALLERIRELQMINWKSEHKVHVLHSLFWVNTNKISAQYYIIITCSV